MDQRKCRRCGRELDTPDRRRQYCPECGARRKAENQRAIRLRRGQGQGSRLSCRRCGAAFHARRRDAKWCPVCRPLVAGGRVHAVEQADVSGRARSILACIHCGARFEALRSDAKWCSDCFETVRARLNARAFESRHRGTCMDCGVSITRRKLRCKACSNRHRNEQYTGERNPNWRGGRTTRNGYVFVKGALGRGGRYRGEHRVVWEQTHGHPLPKGWVVHHLNGQKQDNRPGNLAGMPRHAHHKHPREALVPYEQRIAALERLLARAGVPIPEFAAWAYEHDHEHEHALTDHM